jgi:hypothetical protein
MPVRTGVDFKCMMARNGATRGNRPVTSHAHAETQMTERMRRDRAPSV